MAYMEMIIILLIGMACDMQGFYQQEMPDFIVACSNFETLDETMNHWNGFAKATDYKIIYVVDERSMVPDSYDEHGRKLPLNGIAYPTLNYGIAYRYVHVVIHEAAHLMCGPYCGHGPMWEMWERELTV